MRHIWIPFVNSLARSSHRPEYRPDGLRRYRLLALPRPSIIPGKTNTELVCLIRRPCMAAYRLRSPIFVFAVEEEAKPVRGGVFVLPAG
jgi:hypothetical protein